jgi:hypothetical protein
MGNTMYEPWQKNECPNGYLSRFSFRELLKIFKKLDKNIELGDSGSTSYKYGIGLYVPSMEDEDINSPPESVIIFEKGYYQ